MQETARDVDLTAFETLGTDSVTCPRCGTVNPGFARFCCQCGEGLSGTSEPGIPEAPGQRQDVLGAPAPPYGADGDIGDKQGAHAATVFHPAEDPEADGLSGGSAAFQKATSDGLIDAVSSALVDDVSLGFDSGPEGIKSASPSLLGEDGTEANGATASSEQGDAETISGSLAGEDAPPLAGLDSDVSAPDAPISAASTVGALAPDALAPDALASDAPASESAISDALAPEASSAGAPDVSASKTSAKKHRWLLPALAAVVAVVAAVALLWNPRSASMSAAASDYVGQSGDAVLSEFTDLGFEDIRVVEVPNTADSAAGSVMRISVKGDAEFLEGERFPLEDRVVITQYEGTYSGSPSATNEASSESTEGSGESSTPADRADDLGSSDASTNGAVVPVSDAGSTGEDDGLQYTVESDGSVTITKYSGGDSYVSISSEIDDHPVKKIADGAFEGCTSLQSLTLWADITELGSSAFKGCTALTSISLPSSLTVIRDATFEGCTSLESAIIWGNVTEWGSACFKGCTALASISIDSSTDRIGDSAFQGCTALESVIFWGGKVIGKSAFQGCTALTSLSIPSETTSIESKAFEGCTNLESVIVWPDDDEITIAPDAFENCPNANIQL